MDSIPSAVRTRFKSVLTNDWHSGQYASPTKARVTFVDDDEWSIEVKRARSTKSFIVSYFCTSTGFLETLSLR